MSDVFLIHGWSVTSTETYRDLHNRLKENGLDLREVHLGRYVSLDDEIEVGDLARALQQALVDSLGEPPWANEFHFITHSTGALVLRHWAVHHYVGDSLKNKPVGNMVFLAGPHGGSRLAHHGRSMIATVKFLGDTGKTLLRALELGSPFTWDGNSEWMDIGNWKDKGIRPFCLTGDRVEIEGLAQRIFSAGREPGSDMVIRVPAANLNMRRYRLHAANTSLERVGEISGVAFGALWRYTHSGPDYGIMNSIGEDANPREDRWQNLRLIVECLKVSSERDYAEAFASLAEASKQRRTGPFSQLVFRFIDQDGKPVNDYRVVLGRGENESAAAVEHVHKNHVEENRLVVFVDLSRLDRRYSYFLEFHAETGSPLTHYDPADFRVEIQRDIVEDVIRPDEITEIEVVVPRGAHKNLFRFHPASETDDRIKWNRQGEVD
ncbi:MAG: hypothetical protein V2J10_09730 [Wenzhouxiangella sp.]|jgi:hypothetical protein|nr:hypothetical protein [Wenzhouxiangella sp.]